MELKYGKDLLRHSALAAAGLTGLLYLAEWLLPGTVLPYLDLRWFVIVTLVLNIIHIFYV